jgi:hypothetical protein
MAIEKKWTIFGRISNLFQMTEAPFNPKRAVDRFGSTIDSLDANFFPFGLHSHNPTRVQ